MKALGARLVGVRQGPWEEVGGSPSLDELFQERVQWPCLLEVAAKADLIVLTCTATPATRGMVNDTFLRACRPGVVIINVARGDTAPIPPVLTGHR